MAKLLPTPYPLPAPGRFDPKDPHVVEFERLSAVARTLDDDEYVGALVQWQVADGYAVYLVTSMEGSGTLQHVPFADAYTVDPALIRGLRKADIKDRVDSARALDRLFGEAVMAGEKPGDRVRLLLPMDLDQAASAALGRDYEDLEPGTEGTVTDVDHAGTVHVEWDNGRWLGLLPGIDFWVKL